MNVHLTEEAIGLLWFMFCNPNGQWEKADQIDVSDYSAKREFAAISRFVEEKLLGPKVVSDKLRAKMILDAIQKSLDAPESKNELEREKAQADTNAAFGMISDMLTRKFVAGDFKIKKSIVERIEETSKHYERKKAKTLSPVHWSDLRDGLKGEKAASADDVLEP